MHISIHIRFCMSPYLPPSVSFFSSSLSVPPFLRRTVAILDSGSKTLVPPPCSSGFLFIRMLMGRKARSGEEQSWETKNGGRGWSVEDGEGENGWGANHSPCSDANARI